jgi:CHAT domain-containing protein
MKKILILSANPKNTSQLRLQEEEREIKQALKLSKHREEFEIVTESALQVNDLRRALLDNKPDIVHFSGHGAGSDGLALEDKSGQMQLVSSESLAGLFKSFEEQIECVVLSACYSEIQAEAIFNHIDCVIGMNRAIGDRAAIEFATGFYDALAAGRSYRDAFEFGCGAIDLQGIPESKTPKIKARKNLYAVTLKPEKSKKPVESANVSQSFNGGTIYGAVIGSQGDNNQQTTNFQTINNSEEQQNIAQTAREIQQNLQRLEQNNPGKTNSQKMMIAAQAVEEIESNSAFKNRVINALKARGKETFKELINHPLANIFMACIDDW